MHRFLTRSLLQPCVPQRVSKHYFSILFCVPVEWWAALGEGKAAPRCCADLLLHLPPPLRSPSLPSQKTCVPTPVSHRQRCQAPLEGLQLQLALGNRLAQCVKLNADFRARGKQGKLQLGGAWE